MNIIEKIGMTFVGLTGISFSILLFVFAICIPFAIIAIPVVMMAICAIGYFVYQIWKVWANKF